MSITPDDIRSAVAARLGEAQQFLAELIATPSLPGEEAAAIDLAAEAFSRVAEVRRVGMTNALREDADYCDVIEGIEYDGRDNLRIVSPGTGGGSNLLLNAHIDTVPPSQGQESPFEPRWIDGALYGRGSCDANGQVATAFLMMAALKDLAVTLPGDVIAHVVVEEENGGNGSLAMVRRGESAGACVVLEPTEKRILSSIRGAIWFRITLEGKPGHSGKAGATRSALKMATRVIEILEGYHARLLAASRGDPMFDKYPNPTPLTLGKLHAGNWPATAPGEAVLEGVLGLLPNKTAARVMSEMNAAIRDEGGDQIAEHYSIHFTYRHDSSVCATDHPLVNHLASAVSDLGGEPVIDAMTASCDAWLYNNQLGIPTVVFGGGSLSVAHSNNEHMPVAELGEAAEILALLATRWCGSESPC